jgi:hypothetical protein
VREIGENKYQLKNTSYSRNVSRNVGLPYRKDWYDQDTFSYIDQGVAL